MAVNFIASFKIQKKKSLENLDISHSFGHKDEQRVRLVFYDWYFLHFYFEDCNKKFSRNPSNMMPRYDEEDN